MEFARKGAKGVYENLSGMELKTIISSMNQAGALTLLKWLLGRVFP